MAGRRRNIWSSWPATLGIGVGAVVLAHLLDGWAFETFTDPVVKARIMGDAYDETAKRYADHDWYQMLRQLGSVLPWLFVALMLWLMEGDRREQVRRAQGSRPLLIASGVLGAGAIAEMLKPFIGRKRPEDTKGLYEFFSMNDAFGHWSDCGIPSSHGAVAFAGAAAVATFHPRAGWVLIPLACGTCWTRVANGNHFLSDVVAGAVIGVITVKILRMVLGADR